MLKQKIQNTKEGLCSVTGGGGGVCMFCCCLLLFLLFSAIHVWERVFMKEGNMKVLCFYCVPSFVSFGVLSPFVKLHEKIFIQGLNSQSEHLGEQELEYVKWSGTQ